MPKLRFKERKSWIALLNAYNTQCIYCGRYQRITADHIIPVSKGGINSIWNCLPACWKCNGDRSNQDIIKFIINHDFDRQKIIKRWKNGLNKFTIIMNTLRQIAWNNCKLSKLKSRCKQGRKDRDESNLIRANAIKLQKNLINELHYNMIK